MAVSTGTTLRRLHQVSAVRWPEKPDTAGPPRGRNAEVGEVSILYRKADHHEAHGGVEVRRGVPGSREALSGTPSNGTQVVVARLAP